MFDLNPESDGEVLDEMRKMLQMNGQVSADIKEVQVVPDTLKDPYYRMVTGRGFSRDDNRYRKGSRSGSYGGKFKRGYNNDRYNRHDDYRGGGGYKPTFMRSSNDRDFRR